MAKQWTANSFIEAVGQAAECFNEAIEEARQEGRKAALREVVAKIRTWAEEGVWPEWTALGKVAEKIEREFLG